MRTIPAWIWFALVQAVSLLAMVLGWILLIPFCLAQAWRESAISNKDGRSIDIWSWKPLNLLYGNPEDGVSGQAALIWVNGALSIYKPNAWAPWRAYCWSAWRNSADNLKYVFKWIGGPFKRWQNGVFYVQLGWNTDGLPVLSAGRM